MAKFEILNPNEQTPIMGAPQGTSQMQNNGYRSSANAISELIDNSIQAEAENIDIIIIFQNKGGHDHIQNIIIVDDGTGMESEVFKNASQLQGGTRFHDETGLGRYGMGLPSASINQTTYYEIYTKTVSEKDLLYTYFDLVENVKNNNAFLNPIQKVNLSGYGDELLDDCCGEYLKSKGTLVHWKNPNRLTYKTLKRFHSNMKDILGRKFRYFINDNSVQIQLKAFEYNGSTLSEKRNFRQKIKAFDPMFLMENTITAKPEIGGNFSPPGVTSQVHHDVEIPLIFTETIEEEGDSKTFDHKIRLKFSHVKKEVRQFYKNSSLKAGDQPLGKLYKFRQDKDKVYPIVSILRSNREIDANNYNFIKLSTGGGVDEMNRWVSVEIHIDTAKSDRLFEIDQKKQNAKLYTNISPEKITGFKQKVHHELSSLIRINIERMRKIVRSQVNVPNPNPNPNPDPDNPFIFTENNFNKKVYLSKEDRENLKKWLTNSFPDIKSKKINEYINYVEEYKRKDFIFFKDLPDGVLYNAIPAGEKNIIEINTSHHFYTKFIEKIIEGGDEIAFRITRLLFCSLISAEQHAASGDQKF